MAAVSYTHLQMVVNPEQAEIVKYIFAEVLSGKGTQKIADDLNQKGIPSKRGGRWTATTIRGILKNEKYTGDVILQKTYTDSRFNKRTNYGEKNRYLIENHHEAIISHEVFEAVEAAVSYTHLLRESSMVAILEENLLGRTCH